MSRIYTEIRIPHKSEEDKKLYESDLDGSLTRLGYNNRAEWLRQMVREAQQKAVQKYIDENIKAMGKEKGND